MNPYRIAEKYSNLQPCERKAIKYGTLAGISALGTIASGIVIMHPDINTQTQSIFTCLSAFFALSSFISISRWADYHRMGSRLKPEPKGDLTKFLEQS